MLRRIRIIGDIPNEARMKAHRKITRELSRKSLYIGSHKFIIFIEKIENKYETRIQCKKCGHNSIFIGDSILSETIMHAIYRAILDIDKDCRVHLIRIIIG